MWCTANEATCAVCAFFGLCVHCAFISDAEWFLLHSMFVTGESVLEKARRAAGVREKSCQTDGKTCLAEWTVIRIYTLSQKNIPDVFDCNLKTNYQILIIFGTNIPDTTCHQMTIQFSISPSICFCTTSGKHSQRNITFLSNAIWLLN